MFSLIPYNTKIDFVGKRNLWLGVSMILMIGTIVLWYQKGLNVGIDFTGGAEVQIRAPKAWNITQIREKLTQGGVEGLRVVQLGDPSANEYLIRARGDDSSLKEVSQKIDSVFKKEFTEGTGDNQYQVLKEDVVGAVAGGLLAKKGFWAVFYALLIILIYVSIRFDVRYAPGAVLALFHDSMIVIGMFILTQRQFDLTILAAILAIVGYSNNDTIIIYDRVRETLQLHPNMKIEDAVNQSINETLARTFNTSFTTFVVVAALWWFGGPVIQDFSFAYMVGLVTGTYSSVFVAGAVLIAFTKYQMKRQKAAR